MVEVALTEDILDKPKDFTKGFNDFLLINGQRIVRGSSGTADAVIFTVEEGFEFYLFNASLSTAVDSAAGLGGGANLFIRQDSTSTVERVIGTQAPDTVSDLFTNAISTSFTTPIKLNSGESIELALDNTGGSINCTSAIYGIRIKKEIAFP